MIAKLSNPQPKRGSLLRKYHFFRALFSNRLAVTGLILVGILTLLPLIYQILFQWILPRTIYDPYTGYDFAVLHPSMPSLAHPLGTDVQGHDILSILMAASAPSILVAWTAGLIAAFTGTLLGTVSACFQGRLADYSLGVLSDAFLLIPAPVFMIILGSRFAEMSRLTFAILFGLILGISQVTINIRTASLKVMVKPFIEAAVAAGAGPGHLIFRHLIPCMAPFTALYMTLVASSAVITDGFISYMGFASHQYNWGYMIYSGITNGLNFSGSAEWNMILPPAAGLFLLSLGFYLVSTGLHEISDPTLKERED